MTDTIKIPFGEHKGEFFKVWKIPSGILKWIAENHFNDRIATAADTEYQWREKNNEHFSDWGE